MSGNFYSVRVTLKIVSVVACYFDFVVNLTHPTFQCHHGLPHPASTRKT